VGGSETIPHTRLAEFRAALRELRQRAGDPTYRTMKRRSGVSVATLHNVDAGHTVPTLGATLAYVYACDGDQQLWAAQHRELRRGARSTTPFMPWRNYFEAEKASLPPTVAVLRAEMRRLRFNSGLTLQELSKKTMEPHIAEIVGEWGLGSTTISDLCNPARTGVPRRRTLHGFLLAVGVEQSIIERWLTTRNRLAAKRDPHLELTTGSHDIVTVAPNAGGMPAELFGGPSQVVNGTPDGSALAAPTTPGELLLARFRRLRADLEPGGATPSPERIERVLRSIGVPASTAAELAHQDPAFTLAFVMATERELERITTTPPFNVRSSVGFALELAARRVIAVPSNVPVHEVIDAQLNLRKAQAQFERAETAHHHAESELQVLREASRRASADLNEAWLRGAQIQKKAADRSRRAVAMRTEESIRTANAWALAIAAHGVWRHIAEQHERQVRAAHEDSVRELRRIGLQRERARRLLDQAARDLNDLVDRRLVNSRPM
jgi:hypothetical protein